MAQGDIIIFDTAHLNLINDWDDSNTFFYGIVTSSAPTPTRDTVAPHWNGTGTTNFYTYQVSIGGTSYTGPKSLGSFTYTETTNIFTLDFANPTTINQDASGFTDGRWVIIYNNTDNSKRCFAAIDLGGPISIQSGNFDFDFHANGLMQITG